MYDSGTGGYGFVYLVWHPHRDLCFSGGSGHFSGKVWPVGPGVLCTHSVYPGGDPDPSGSYRLPGRRFDLRTGLGICIQLCGNIHGLHTGFCSLKKIQHMIGEKNYHKYIGWLDKGTAFDKAFAAAIFFPVAPDDLLCYIAGLTKMTLKKFTLIIILGKPGSIFLYSLGLTSITQLLQHFLR